MTRRGCGLMLVTFGLASCGPSNQNSGLTAERARAVDQEVRAFAQTVAHDITQEGPLAWRRFFADSPAFFMAAAGRLEYPTSAAATTGIKDLPRFIKSIDLKWGDDLRVDALTRELAVMGATFHEVMISP